MLYDEDKQKQLRQKFGGVGLASEMIAQARAYETGFHTPTQQLYGARRPVGKGSTKKGQKPQHPKKQKHHEKPKPVKVNGQMLNVSCGWQEVPGVNGTHRHWNCKWKCLQFHKVHWKCGWIRVEFHPAHEAGPGAVVAAKVETQKVGPGKAGPGKAGPGKSTAAIETTIEKAKKATPKPAEKTKQVKDVGDAEAAVKANVHMVKHALDNLRGVNLKDKNKQGLQGH